MRRAETRGCHVALVAVLALAVACTKPPPSSKDGSAGLEASARKHAGAGLKTAAPNAAAGDYVGSADCGRCHQTHYAKWKGSMHAIALGVVSGSARSRPGIDGLALEVGWGRGASGKIASDEEAGTLKLEVREDDVDPGPYPLPYVLGGRYIAQYLARTEDGRMQALAVGFDPIKGDWFDIFPDSPRKAEDWGHWTNRGMTANSECISCHVTGFEKGYQARSDGYRTRWAEAGVGCEACHGPGLWHASVRQSEAEQDQVSGNDSYLVPQGRAMMDGCAPCHGLRRETRGGYSAGQPLLDYFEPILLDDADYQVDGQIIGEDYEWGSFLQSRMYEKDVTCLDCHDIHSGELRAKGDQLCVRCHESGYSAPTHTHHEPASTGAACVGCHMPEHVYMERDYRRDHKMVIPDPELTLLTGTSNPCTQCHSDKSPQWAADQVQEWYPDAGGQRMRRRAVAVAFAKGRLGDPSALDELLECVRSCPSVIRRASALKLLAGFAAADERVRSILGAAAGNQEPLVRYAATWALAEGCAASHVDCLRVLLASASDPLRAIRTSAAWGLRSLRTEGLSDSERSTLQAAFADLEASLAYRDDYAEARYSRGVFDEARGSLDAAEAAYRGALKLAPEMTVARYSLAVLLARRGSVAEARDELERVTAEQPDLAPAHYALGLVYGDEGNWREAVRSLTECLKLEPYYPDALHELAHAYVALGEGDLARDVLRAALTHPRARAEALRTLVSVNLELGATEQARAWARKAASEIPGFGDTASVRELLAK